MSTLKLLTFNTWGLKFISKDRTPRLRAIGDALANPIDEDHDYDIVALQEVWCEEDWNYIDAKCAERYPHRRYFKSGIISGPGLALLSKIAIEETFLYRFPINGRPSAIFRGDWYVGKSIAVTLLKPVSASATPIALLNSHMHAPYSKEGDASYSCHRACQAWDFAKYVRMLRKAGYAVIQVGDLNSEPGTLPHRLFTTEGGLDDSWTLMHPKVYTKDDIATMSAIEQIEKAGVTCDSVANTWRANRPLEDACRLDYAFIDTSYITPKRGQVQFIDRVPGLGCSYSDHFAYFVEVEVADYDSSVVSRVRSDSYGAARAARANRDIISPTVHKFPTTQVKKDEFRDLRARVAVYKDLLKEISTYRRFTIPYQSSWRKQHFFSSMGIVVALHLMVLFTSTMDSVTMALTMLLAVVVGISGVINGLIWGLGIRAESRSLQEVHQQVKDKLNAIKGEVNEFIESSVWELEEVE